MASIKTPVNKNPFSPKKHGTGLKNYGLKDSKLLHERFSMPKSSRKPKLFKVSVPKPKHGKSSPKKHRAQHAKPNVMPKAQSISLGAINCDSESPTELALRGTKWKTATPKDLPVIATPNSAISRITTPEQSYSRSVTLNNSLSNHSRSPSPLPEWNLPDHTFCATHGMRGAEADVAITLIKLQQQFDHLRSRYCTDINSWTSALHAKFKSISTLGITIAKGRFRSFEEFSERVDDLIDLREEYYFNEDSSSWRKKLSYLMIELGGLRDVLRGCMELVWEFDQKAGLIKEPL